MTWFNIYPMGKIICTIKVWWNEQKEDIQTFFSTLYEFYTAPVEVEYAPVLNYDSQDYMMN